MQKQNSINDENLFFADADNRLRKTNRVVAIGGFLVLAAYVYAGITSTGAMVTKTPMLRWIGIGVCALLALLNVIFAYCVRNAKAAATVIMLSIVVSYIMCDIIASDVFLPYIVFAPLVFMTTYDDQKMLRVATIFTTVFGVVTKLVDLKGVAAGNDALKVETIGGIIFLLIFCVACLMVARITKKYNSAIFAKSDNRSERLRDTMSNVSSAVSTINDETNSAMAQIEQLTAATDVSLANTLSVQTKIQDTADTAVVTTDAVKIISESISANAEEIEQMRKLIENTQKILEEQASSMKELNVLTDNVENSHNDISASLKEFLNTINDVKATIQNVETISSRITLLALNASIEAARAGEAGRSFAVVAEQIKDLASQSKDCVTQMEASTDFMNSQSDSIAGALTALNEVSATQVERIAEVSESINKSAAIMESLVTNTENVWKQSDNMVAQTEKLNSTADNLQEIARNALNDIEVVASEQNTISTSLKEVESAMSNIAESFGNIDTEEIAD